MQLHKKIKRLMRRLRHHGPTRINREGMPNGFFLNDLLWFGDGGSEQTAVAVVLLSSPSRCIQWTMRLRAICRIG